MSTVELAPGRTDAVPVSGGQTLEDINDRARLAAEAGDHGTAAALLRKVIQRRPDLVVIRRNLVRALEHGGRYWEATDACRSAVVDHPGDLALAELLARLARRTGQAHVEVDASHRLVAIEPDQPAHHRRLVQLLRRANDSAALHAATEAWATCEPDNATAQHLLAAFAERPPARASDTYISSLFDAYAPKFDGHLAALGYCAPNVLAERVAALDPEGWESAVDLGCGTGLLGPLIRSRTKELVGVDLSAGMLERAGARNVYDSLAHEELTAYLSTQVERFDLVASTDTLIYLGALEPVAAGAHRALCAGGLLAFTVELGDDRTAGGDGYRLQECGRYTHDSAYVDRVLRDAGFTEIEMSIDTMRREGGTDVQGLVVTARR